MYVEMQGDTRAGYDFAAASIFILPRPRERRIAQLGKETAKLMWYETVNEAERVCEF